MQRHGGLRVLYNTDYQVLYCVDVQVLYNTVQVEIFNQFIWLAWVGRSISGIHPWVGDRHRQPHWGITYPAAGYARQTSGKPQGGAG